MNGDDTIVLRRPTEADVEQVVALTDDPDIARYTNVPSPNTPADVRAWIGGSLGGAHFLIAEPAAPAVVLGAVGIHHVDEERAAAEIGYWVGREHRGRGLAARAVTLLARWALDEAGLARIALLADEANTPSRRVAEKAGFAFEGILVSYEPRKDGTRRDVACYALVA